MRSHYRKIFRQEWCMTKLKKIKKWASRTHSDVERAERAADRAEAALQRLTELRATTGHNSDDTTGVRSLIYTGMPGRDETPAAAAVGNPNQHGR